MSAPAGVSGATYGSYAFDGTSASTPHVAGAAALVWSVFPAFDRHEVASYLTSHALDLGAAGPDNAYGHGRLQLAAPPETEEPPLLSDATEIPPPTIGLETPVPTVTPLLVGTPVPSPAPLQPSPSPTPGSASATSTSGPPAALLIGLALIGLFGGTAVVGGTGLLLLARRGTFRSSPEPPPVISAPMPPPLPQRYGELAGAGLNPVSLQDGTIVLGRDPGNDVVLRSERVSRRHARITCADGVCRVEDLASSNGTFVNGERVTQAVLRPGSRLRLGDMELTYATEGREQAGAWLQVGEKHYSIPPAGATIGRSTNSDVRLDDQLASRRHARIDRREGEFVISDLESTNGTFVNERPVHLEPLRDGDTIRIGRTYLHFYSQDLS
jgi:pSer/pThr/pTyr-binding forkhead associated (FHA) protein